MSSTLNFIQMEPRNNTVNTPLIPVTQRETFYRCCSSENFRHQKWVEITLLATGIIFFISAATLKITEKDPSEQHHNIGSWIFTGLGGLTLVTYIIINIANGSAIAASCLKKKSIDPQKQLSASQKV